ncbi:MAG: hypothetical protein KC978_24010, partial [Candidatus Omnitrophica bacterium]|nr:hypothetical protein [Candidatus Omnitrophota bacterium]
MNRDNLVDHNDLIMMGECMYLGSSHCDLNQDGQVDNQDILLFGRDWLNDTAKGVPSEPAAKGLRNGVLGIDLSPGDPRFTDSESPDIVDSDSVIDTTLTLSVGQEFSALIRFNEVADLMGVGFDFFFDNTLLEVLDIRETRMDLNYDGVQNPIEREAIQGFYNDLQPPQTPSVNQFTYSLDNGERVIVVQPG